MNAPVTTGPPVPGPTGPAPTTPLETALARLVSAGTLTCDQADAVLTETALVTPVETTRPRTPRPAFSWSALLSEVGGYVGGAFVVAAVAVLTGPNWDKISHAQRLAVFAVPAVLLAVAAVLVARGTPGGWTVQERHGTTSRRRLVAVLLGVAAALGGGFAAVVNSGPGDETAFCLTASALAALAYVGCRGLVLHALSAAWLAFGAGSLVTHLVGHDAGDSWVYEQRWIGVVLVVIGVAWAALALLGVLAERAFGLLVAGVLVFFGGEYLANLGDALDGQSWIGYLVLAALALSALGGYVRLHHVALLGVGVVALATVVPQAVIDYTDGALGAAGALLVTGLSIVGASVAGLRLRKEVTPTTP